MDKIFKVRFFHLILLFFALLVAGCADTSPEATEPETDDNDEQEEAASPIAIQGALDVEVSAILDEMGEYEEETHNNYTFYVGEIDDIPIVVSRTEVGMVHAAAATTVLIEKYSPLAIINQGTAGGHDPELDVFDIVIGKKVMNIGMYHTDHLDEGDGIEPKEWKLTPTKMRENGEIEEYDSFTSTSDLVQIASSITDKYEHGKVVEGKIGSADVWNREIDRINWFHEEVGTDAEEMEAAAVVQVAQNNDIPYLSVRIISNSEVADDDTEDLETAGQYGAEFVVDIVREIGK